MPKIMDFNKSKIYQKFLEYKKNYEDDINKNNNNEITIKYLKSLENKILDKSEYIVHASQYLEISNKGKIWHKTILGRKHDSIDSILNLYGDLNIKMTPFIIKIIHGYLLKSVEVIDGEICSSNIMIHKLCQQFPLL